MLRFPSEIKHYGIILCSQCGKPMEVSPAAVPFEGIIVCGQCGIRLRRRYAE